MPFSNSYVQLWGKKIPRVILSFTDLSLIPYFAPSLGCTGRNLIPLTPPPLGDSGSKWCHQCKKAALIFRLFWLHFLSFTVEGNGDTEPSLFRSIYYTQKVHQFAVFAPVTSEGQAPTWPHISYKLTLCVPFSQQSVTERHLSDLINSFENIMRQTKQDILVGKPNYGQEKMLGAAAERSRTASNTGCLCPIESW